MSNEPKPGPAPDTPVSPASSDGAPAAPAAASDGAPTDEAQKLRARNEELEGQIKDLTDRLLRAHAEMDNFRKRSEREREETAKYAISKFARDLVGIGDNFQRAVAAVPAASIEADPALKSLVDGVQMTEREFLKSLDKNGVRRIDPKGEAFNPHQHQAVMERHNPDVAPGTVVEVFQMGFMIEDRCLRPAMVVVATGGQKPAKPSAVAADNGAGKPADGKSESEGPGGAAG